MTSETITKISAPADLDRLVAAACVSDAPHFARLAKAVRAGTHNLVIPNRQAMAPMGMLKRSPRPVVLLLGDDDYCSTGPNGWACVPKVFAWAQKALVHGTGADIASYQMALDAASVCRRFLLVETDSSLATEWAEAIAAARSAIPTLILLPRDGVHPVGMAGGGR
jgi:hypothetical protein